MVNDHPARANRRQIAGTARVDQRNNLPLRRISRPLGRKHLRRALAGPSLRRHPEVWAAEPTIVRLLDLVAHGTEAPAALPRHWPFPQAQHFSDAVRACPLRLVMADDLTACATQLAYADGDRLGSCLDLLHVPAQHMWVEWIEAARRTTLQQIPDFRANGYITAWRRAGVLVTADCSGRRGTIRTFWSTRQEEVLAGALISQFDLDRDIRPPVDVAAVFNGGAVGVTIPEEPSLDELLSHVRYTFDPAWAAYYRSAQLSHVHQCAVLHHSLGGSAFDWPMLCALFLLYSARDGLSRRQADFRRLNAARRQAGKPCLLEHLELRAALSTSMEHAARAEAVRSRRSPRLHHVRGHIARRGDKVFWKSPCLRGNSAYGVVRSRTVELRFN